MNDLKNTVIGILAFLLLLACGMVLQARWDKACGDGNRWDGEEWRCVSQDYGG